MPLALTGYELGLLLTALTFIAFALVVALVVPRSRPGFPSPRLGVFIAICLVFFAAQITAVVLLAEVGEADEPVAHETEPGGTETEPSGTEPTETGATETTGPSQPAGDAEAGREIFATQGCVTCHTLADAGASGTLCPNLDEAQPPSALVVERVTNGMGAMPSFSDKLSAQQIQDVAAYVSSVAGS